MAELDRNPKPAAGETPDSLPCSELMPPSGLSAAENSSAYSKLGSAIIPQSFLFMPGDKPTVLDGLINKPSLSGAHVILDLEDGIKAKGAEPRETLIDFLNTNHFTSQVVAIRVNSPTTEIGNDDIHALLQNQKVGGAANRFDALVIPKVESAVEVYHLCAALTRLEESAGWEQRVKLELLIESPKGIRNLDAIADAVCLARRGAGLMFGLADYVKEIGAGDFSGDLASFQAQFGYPMAEIGCAARAHGLHAIAPIDKRIPDKFTDQASRQEIESAITEKMRWARALGFQGALAIHPSQRLPIALAFAPRADEIDFHIERLNEFFDHNQESFVHQGEMVDLPVAIASLEILRAAVAAQMLASERFDLFAARFRSEP